MEKWNPKYEMEYWNGVTDISCKNKIASKYKYFNVDGIIADHFIKTPNIAIDIAGGMFGGALQYFNANKKILIDYLADEFVKMGKIPADVKAQKGNFCNLPFENKTVDVIFCWEALDHCNSLEDFQIAQQEINRVLAPKGILFFEMPIRPKPINGHLISLECINRDEIVNGFNGTVLKRLDKGPQFKSPNPIMLIIKAYE